jgi:hypothetical protein
MKIIGQQEYGWILTATNEEIANFIGFYSSYDRNFSRPKIGDEVLVSAVYEQLKGFARAKQQLDKFAAELRNIADALEIKSPLLRKAIETAEKTVLP